MRGSIKKRYPGSYSIILDVDTVTNPLTGLPKRKQQWITVKGTKQDAQTRLNDLLSEQQHGTFVSPDKRTLGDWLVQWLDMAMKPPRRTLATYERYGSAIRLHLKPKLGAIRLQELRPDHIERFYAEMASFSAATVELFHMILHAALEDAVRGQLVARNVAKLVTGKPHAPDGHQDAMLHCWTADEASLVVAAAKAMGPRQAAFYALALDSGARKAELCGLKWTDLDIPGVRVRIERQLIQIKAHGDKDAKADGPRVPVFGPPKGKKPRVIDISSETLALLLAHKANQARIKMANRLHYRDHGLMFAKEWDGARGRLDGHDTLGAPMQMSNLGQREFARVIAAADVRAIKFHGLRHTCATLMLANGVPAKVVQERLGHKKITTTLDTYAHVLPSMQADAARQLGALLHRS